MKKKFIIPLLLAALFLLCLPGGVFASTAETIDTTVSVTENTVYEDKDFTINARVGFDVADGVSLTFKNCTLNVVPTGSADTTSDAAIAIEADSGTASVILENTTVNLGKEYCRGIVISGNQSTATLDNSKIEFASTDSGTLSVYSRGISAYQNNSGDTLSIQLKNNSEIAGCYYPLNINGEGTTVTMNDSTLSGYCALNIWGNGSTITATDSKLIGNDYYSGGSDDFAVIPQNFHDYPTDSDPVAFTVKLTGCQLVSNQYGTCSEDGISQYLDDDNAAAMVLNNVKIVMCIDGAAKDIGGKPYPQNLSAENVAAITVATSSSDSVVTTPGLDVPANIEVGDDNALIDVDPDALAAALAGNTDVSTVSFDLTDTTDTIDTVTIPADVYDVICSAAADSGNSVSGLSVETNTAKLTFDSDALSALAAGSGDLTLDIQAVDTTNLSTDQAALVGDGTVLSFEADKGGAAVSDFGTGTVTVSIPVTGAAKDNMIVWRMTTTADNKTELTPLTCTYNPTTNCYEFETNHFSTYVLDQFPYTDVTAGEWDYETMVYAVNNDIFNGTSATTLEPDTQMTRAMIVEALWRLAGSPDAASAGFSDVNENMWYADAINWAASVNIVKGIGNHLYAPDVSLTREEMAQILYAYAQYLGYSVDGDFNLGGFSDASSVSSWALTSMKWATGNHLIVGMGNGILAPKDIATRAQFAKVMENFAQEIGSFHPAQN
jgi:hypothetical protein